MIWYVVATAVVGFLIIRAVDILVLRRYIEQRRRIASEVIRTRDAAKIAHHNDNSGDVKITPILSIRNGEVDEIYTTSISAEHNG